MIQLLLTVFLVLEGAAHTDGLSPRQAKAAQSYTRALEGVRNGCRTASLEQAFTFALEIRELLGGFSTGEPSIEDLADRDFQQLQRQLTGIVLNRDEVILAEPDAAFFSDLASRYGGPVDREFFAVFAATFPQGVWPVYMTQQTDFSGCTEFGEGHLVRSYRAWTSFTALHPGRYQREADRIIMEIEEEVLSTCACGDQNAVLRELNEFASAFPRSPVHGAVLIRILKLHRGSSPVRFNCISG